MAIIDDILISLNTRGSKPSESDLRKLPFRKADIYGRQSDPSQVRDHKQSLLEIADLVELAKNDGYKSELTKEQVEAWLLSIQRGETEKGVLVNGDIMVDVRDLGISGQLSAEYREGLTALINGIENNEIGSVYVAEPSRLTRDREGLQPPIFLRLFKTHFCRVRTPEGTWNAAIPADWEYLHEEFQLARKENIHFGRRLYRKRKKKAGNGDYVGEPVTLGYKLKILRISSNGRYEFGRMEPYAPHAEIVNEILREYLNQDGSWQRTAQALKGTIIPFFEPELNYMCNYSVLRQCTELADGYKITPTLIKGVVKNPKIIGIHYWGDTVPIAHNHEPIVSEELFTRAYTVATRKGKPKGKTVRFEPLVLSGLLMCCEHQEPIVMSSNRKEGRYRCDRGYRSGQDHHCMLITDHLVDEPVTSAILGQLDLTPFAQEVLDKFETDVAQVNVEKMNYRKKVSELKQRLENLKPYLGCGDPKREDIYWDLYQETLDTINDLQAKPPSDITKSKGTDITKLRMFLSELPKNWQLFNHSQQNRFIGLFIDRIDVWHKDRRIDLQIIWKNGFVQSLTIDLPKANNKLGNAWTSQEKNLLRLLWRDYSREDIQGALPNRSWGAIQSQAHVMKLKRQVGHSNRTYHGPWTDAEEANARKLWELGIRKEEIAHAIGRGENSVAQKARRSGWKRPEHFRKKTSKVLCVGEKLEVLQGLPSQGRW
ncbi:MAG: recombinase family protein [Chloroflexi bacterium]|nr:recombinase family protein [Chloroflexota bacterium]